MTACQTLAQSLSASPSATSYPTTQFSLPPSYHHKISDLSAYNRSFPSKIKCCVDRLSWLPKADNRGRGGNVRLCHEQASRHEAIKKAGRPTLARPARFLAANVSYLMVWITLDIGRASSNPLPISLSTASLYSGSGSTGVFPTTCTTL